MTLDLQNFLLPDSPGTLSSSPIIQEGYIMTAVAPLSQKAQLVPPDAQASAKGSPTAPTPPPSPPRPSKPW